MQFVDYAKISVKAGDGGNGCAAFRRESHTPKGGPSGGDGGNGGSVVFQVDRQLSTLLDFKFKRHFKAIRGEDGRGRDQYGRGGEDLILKVPRGTMVYDDVSGECLADLSDDDSILAICKGGMGGRGNMHFATPWDQAPTKCEPGTPGEERHLRLELKLLADVGLLGYPSVGKSTFISVVSKAKPKIADYPFTTLVPNLGVVRLDIERDMVIADIPGLIEGAAEGAGLGHQFLRHVERSEVLLHILEVSDSTDPERDPISDYQTLNKELKQYAPKLAEKPQIVVLNKMDLPESQAMVEEVRGEFEKLGVSIMTMSAATMDGTRLVLDALWNLLQQARKDA